MKHRKTSAMLSTLCSSIASGSRRGPRRPAESVVRPIRCWPEVARSDCRREQPGAHVKELRRPPHLHAPSLQVRRQLPPLRHFYPRACPRRSWDGDWRPQLLPLDSAARQPPRGSLGPRDAGTGL